MSGVVTKKDLLRVLWYFGWKKALKLLVTNKPVALDILMK